MSERAERAPAEDPNGKDPGLAVTRQRSPLGPFVGTPPPAGGVRRWARDGALERLLDELHRGFGWQYWWPARTPFEVLVGAVLTQHTSWTQAARGVAALDERASLAPRAIVAMPDDELEDAVRPSGSYRVKARKLRALSQAYLDFGGLRYLREAPLEEARRTLLSVWGIGPETADAMLCYGAGRATVVVDVYARRVLERHGFERANAPYEALRTWLLEALQPEQIVYEEFHALAVRAGYRNCKPTPICDSCPATTPENGLPAMR